MDAFEEETTTIGRGAFASCRLVRRKTDGRLLVLKTMNTNVSNLTEQERHDFVNEVRLLGDLNHPNIVQYVGSFVTDVEQHIVMEYAAGGSLAAQIAACETAFAEDQIWEWLAQIAVALQYVHSRNILHRDIKPQNILLWGRSRRVIKLADFGIAKVFNPHQDLAGTMVGTPYYLSPELCEGRTYDQKSDIWALGCVVYELVNLHKPFVGANVPALVLAISRGKHQPLAEQAKQYSNALLTTVERLLCIDPDRRPCIDAICGQQDLNHRIQLWRAVQEAITSADASQEQLEADNYLFLKTEKQKEKAAPGAAVQDETDTQALVEANPVAISTSEEEACDAPEGTLERKGSTRSVRSAAQSVTSGVSGGTQPKGPASPTFGVFRSGMPRYTGRGGSTLEQHSLESHPSRSSGLGSPRPGALNSPGESPLSPSFTTGSRGRSNSRTRQGSSNMSQSKPISKGGSYSSKRWSSGLKSKSSGSGFSTVSFSSLSDYEARIVMSRYLMEVSRIFRWGNGQRKPILDEKLVGFNLTRLASSRFSEATEESTMVLGLGDDGELFSWGSNDFGQLGTAGSQTEKDRVPSLVHYFSDRDVCIADMDCGPTHCVAVSTDGKVYVWGERQAIGSATELQLKREIVRDFSSSRDGSVEVDDLHVLAQSVDEQDLERCRPRISDMSSTCSGRSFLDSECTESPRSTGTGGNAKRGSFRISKTFSRLQDKDGDASDFVEDQQENLSAWPSWAVEEAEGSPLAKHHQGAAQHGTPQDNPFASPRNSGAAPNPFASPRGASSSPESASFTAALSAAEPVEASAENASQGHVEDVEAKFHSCDPPIAQQPAHPSRERSLRSPSLMSIAHRSTSESLWTSNGTESPTMQEMQSLANEVDGVAAFDNAEGDTAEGDTAARKLSIEVSKALLAKVDEEQESKVEGQASLLTGEAQEDKDHAESPKSRSGATKLLPSAASMLQKCRELPHQMIPSKLIGRLVSSPRAESTKTATSSMITFSSKEEQIAKDPDDGVKRTKRSMSTSPLSMIVSPRLRARSATSMRFGSARSLFSSSPISTVHEEGEHAAPADEKEHAKDPRPRGVSAPENLSRAAPSEKPQANEIQETLGTLGTPDTELFASATCSNAILAPGKRIHLLSKKQADCGVIRFVGLTGFAPGVWVGVELDEPQGRNDGVVKGKRYFEAAPSHGLFVRPSHVRVVVPGVEPDFALDSTQLHPNGLEQNATLLRRKDPTRLSLASLGSSMSSLPEPPALLSSEEDSNRSIAARNGPAELSYSIGDWHYTLVDHDKAEGPGSDNLGRLITEPRLVHVLQKTFVIQVMCGEAFTAVLSREGRLLTWGENDYGQLGLGHDDPCDVPTPVQVEDSSVVKAMATGMQHMVAINGDGEVFCWGRGSEGQLGRGEELFDEPNPVPTQVEEITSRVSGIAAGKFHSAAVTEQGEVYTWGCGEDGQLGHGNLENCIAPTPVEALGRSGADIQVVDVTCGAAHTVVLTDSRSVFVWGNDQRNAATSVQMAIPRAMESLTGAAISRICPGSFHTFAVSKVENPQDGL